MLRQVYVPKNVAEAAEERLRYVFDEFEKRWSISPPWIRWSIL